MLWMHFVAICENRRMKPVEIVLGTIAGKHQEYHRVICLQIICCSLLLR
jgi:hypothetical protein